MRPAHAPAEPAFPGAPVRAIHGGHILQPIINAQPSALAIYKTVASDDETRQKFLGERSVQVVHEHPTEIFNAVSSSAAGITGL